MILAVDPRRCRRPNKIGGIYARMVSGRVLVGGRSGVGQKNSGAAVGLAAIRGHRITGMWHDELVAESGGFLPFLGRARRVVAWVASHGVGQGIGNAAFSSVRRIITSLQHGAARRRALVDCDLGRVADRGDMPPRTPPFVLIHPRGAGRSQPAAKVSVGRADPSTFHLKDQAGEIAEVYRVRMGSGVRAVARAAISAAGCAEGSTEALGQGARYVLAQGGMRFATLGGGAGHVNGA